MAQVRVMLSSRVRFANVVSVAVQVNVHECARGTVVSVDVEYVRVLLAGSDTGRIPELPAKLSRLGYRTESAVTAASNLRETHNATLSPLPCPFS